MEQRKNQNSIIMKTTILTIALMLIGSFSLEAQNETLQEQSGLKKDKKKTDSHQIESVQPALYEDDAQPDETADSKEKMSETKETQFKSPRRMNTTTAGGKTITINYGAPSVRERKIWGGLVPYNEVWRTGANEATTIEFNLDVEIEGNKVSAGKYALFTIPAENEWTIILNKEPKQWGAYKYEKNKDVVRFNVNTKQLNEKQEQLEFEFGTDTLTLKWEFIQVPMSIKFK